MDKENVKKFDFKFLNMIMYIGSIIAIYFVLENIGIMDKVIKALVSLTPVYIGILICWVTMPLVNKLRKIGLSKGWASIVSLIIIFGFIIILFSLVIPMFAEQLTSLIKDLPNIYSTVIEKINWFLKDKLSIESGLQISTSINDISLIQNNLGSIVDFSINTLQSAIGVVITIVTTVVVSFFMVKDMDKFKRGVIGFLSRSSKDPNRYKMVNEIDTTITSYVKGIIIDSVIVGLMTTVVCMILKLDYAIVFGMLITVLNLIPYIGAIISEIIAALYALTVGGPILAIITFVCLLGIQLIDANVLQPNIIAKSVNLHPVAVLSGLIVFDLFFGIIGMIIAVPILAIGKIILKYKFSINFDDDDINDEKRPKNKKVASAAK